MDRYLKEKESKPKDVVKLSEDDKINEFIKQVEPNDIIPSQCNKTKDLVFSDGTNMGSWFRDTRKKLSKESNTYIKLSVNETIKKEMDRYLKEKESKN